MQPFGRVSTNGTSYSDATVMAKLLSPEVSERWRFDLLDSQGNWKLDATPFIRFDQSPPVITHDATKAVKRTIAFDAKGTFVPIWLKDRLRPRYGILMPDGGYAEWVLGTFLMELPVREIFPAQTYLHCKGYDMTQGVADGKFLSGFALTAGTNCVAGISAILAQDDFSSTLVAQIPDGGSRLTVPLGWQVGDSILAAVNQVLSSMTFQPVFADEMGVLRSQAFPDYNTVTPTYIFNTLAAVGAQPASLVKIPLKASIDMSQAINFCRVTVENPQTLAAGFFADASNTRPDSPVSIPSWRQRALVVRDSSIVDIASASARALLEIQRGAWIYQTMPVSTPAWPVSQDYDVYGLIYQTLDEGLVSANYLEIGWQHVCRTGAPTIHQFRRLVLAGQA